MVREAHCEGDADKEIPAKRKRKEKSTSIVLFMANIKILPFALPERAKTFSVRRKRIFGNMSTRFFQPDSLIN